MKILKILFGLILLYLGVLLTHFYMLSFYWKSFPISQFEEGSLKYIFSILNIGFSIVYFFASLLIAIGLWKIIRKGFYGKKAAKLFSISGWCLVASGVLQLLLDSYSAYGVEASQSDKYVISFLLSFFLILFGLVLLSVVAILKEGIQLKQENDLTI